MPTVTLKAHFDGSTIRLDEPHELSAGSRLLVTVLPPCWESEWANFSASGLALAYGKNEPEYSEADIQP